MFQLETLLASDKLVSIYGQVWSKIMVMVNMADEDGVLFTGFCDLGDNIWSIL